MKGRQVNEVKGTTPVVITLSLCAPVAKDSRLLSLDGLGTQKLMRFQMSTKLEDVNVLDWMANGNPVAILLKLRASGWVAEHFPELDALWGVEQNPEHHPEVDTGLHTELVLGVAARISTDPRVRWAALVHDLGKGLTPKHELPRHIDHERRGIPLALAAAERFSLPQEWAWLGAVMSQYHLLAHQAFVLKSASLVSLIRESGFLDKPKLFECFVLACEADKRGRAGRTEEAYPQSAYLREVYKVVRSFERRQTLLDRERADAVRVARLAFE
ncbi:HD domain-containing protein [Paraburkholderia sp. UCT31]|uniref:HD domain-containing protein n=1 Tax=Paraburkholderia sp. UCT31 TaxID=2615209 RepID=UPI001654C692|nr:HD domain-containing protein [Paraburkholderia sp. UCT31]MBC8742756.1 HD domain-containing protein [Paraburkholderia sp. UCT31]